MTARDQPAAPAQPPDQPDPNRWRALVVCLVAGFMTLLDVSIVNVALPPMQRSLGASSAELSWVVSGYALTFGLVLVASGRLGDDRGRKKMFLIALALFILTSAVAGLSVNPTMLVVARLLQGVAGGMMNPQIIGVIQQLFSGRERGRAFGLFGAAIGISTAVGPLAGGLLLQCGGDAEGWRWVFYVNVPIGIVALGLGLRLLPRDTVVPGGQRRPLDLVGAVLLGAAVVSLMLPLVLSEQQASSAPWWLVGVAVLLLLVFVAWERRAKQTHGHPLINFGLLRTRSYALGTTLGLVYFAGFTSIFFVLTLFLQQGRGFTPLEAGLALTPFALGSAASSALGGRLISRMGKPLVVGGLLAVVVGLVATDIVLRLDPSNVGWAIAGPLLVAGIGSGLVVAPNQTLALEEVPAREGGTAAGVLQTGQRVGSAIGISAVGSVFFSSLASSHGNWSSSISSGLVVTVGLVVLALIVGIADLVSGRIARRRSARAALTPAPGGRAPAYDGGSRDGVPHDGSQDGVRSDGGSQDGVRSDGGSQDGFRRDGVPQDGLAADGIPHDGDGVSPPDGIGPTVVGRVVRSEDGEPVPDAVLTLVDEAGHQAARTDGAADGTYRLVATAPGMYQLVVRASGRRPDVGRITLSRRQSVCDVVLHPSATEHLLPVVD
ncbi:MFS transporter [Actinomycetospora endophytica]|uniref:MFS transporter n=1 Tax=Actinomycetospora endophytica TaxID=2291215 RepID=A0ABS8P5S4_9PSEU|nr:MFS transporter [Actinomycetospora endophytica]MCD2192746.1 MFS transporter [Actinomycetospora endophytica]